MNVEAICTPCDVNWPRLSAAPFSEHSSRRDRYELAFRDCKKGSS